MTTWPETASELSELQLELASEIPPSRQFEGAAHIGGCFVCFQRGESGPGKAGDRGWTAAALEDTTVSLEGIAPAPYRAGFLALREGELLERAVRALPVLLDVLLVDATGRAMMRAPSAHSSSRTKLSVTGYVHDLGAGPSPFTPRG